MGYRHGTLGPYAISLHLWFLGNSTVMTVLVFYAVTDLGIGAVTMGLVLASSGVAGVLGAGLAPRLAERLGLGRVCVTADWLTALAFACALLARPGPGGVALLVLGQLLWGLGNGITNPLTLSYRNTVTPPALRGRRRGRPAPNWGSIAVSAPLAGLAATAWGNRPVIAAGVVVLAVASLVLTLSPFRRARMPDVAAAAEPADVTSRPLPASARALRTALGDLVSAAAREDAAALAEVRPRLEKVDPEQVRVVLGHVVRALVERTHPDGVDADDLSDLLQDVARASTWCPDLDPSALVAVLSGAFGAVHRDDDEPLPHSAPEIATAAALLAVHLLRGHDVGPLLDAALAEVARRETIESP